MPTMGDRSAKESANAERNLKSLTGRRCSGSSVIEVSAIGVLSCHSGHGGWAGDPVGVREDWLRAGPLGQIRQDDRGDVRWQRRRCGVLVEVMLRLDAAHQRLQPGRYRRRYRSPKNKATRPGANLPTFVLR